MYDILLVAAAIVIVTLFLLYWWTVRLLKSKTVPPGRELLIESIKDIVLHLDASNRVIDMNPAALAFLSTYGKQEKIRKGRRTTDYKGMEIDEVLSFIPEFPRLRGEIENAKKQMFLLKTEAESRYYEIYQASIPVADDQRDGNIYVLSDITETQEKINKLEQANDMLLISERIFSTTVEGVLITDNRGAIMRVNEAFEKMSGYTAKEVIGSNPRIFKSGKQGKRFYSEMWRSIIEKGYWEGEIWDRRKNGELYPKHMSISSLKKFNDEVEHYIAISVDISDLKEAENNLHKLAYYDSLTGIPNRRHFYERVDRTLAQAVKKSRRIAVLMMGLDGFKLINDSLGHSAGDVALKEVAMRLKASIRNMDLAARISGDEFAVVLENIPDIDYVETITQKIVQSIMKPYNIDQKEIMLGISTGIAIAPDDETGAEGLIRKADAAMFVAKKTGGKGCYSFTSEEIERRNHELLEMQLKLQEAIRNEEFLLYLQPQISFENGSFRLVGAEALIRWQMPDNQMCPPNKFIPVAESNGMIVTIGEWIFDEILRINEKLRNSGIDIKLAINVSARQLETDDFFNKIKQNPVILKNQINLELEITERFLLSNFDSSLAMLNKMHDLGIYIALDDFGTGFSSLSYLTRLPIDYLKIDKSFIDDIAVADSRSIVPDIIAMAKKLNMRTIAEGVETKEQVACLLDEKCDEIQGYYFGKPMNLETFIEFAHNFEREHNKEETFI